MSKWTFDTAHSEINFSVRHMMFAKVRGTFHKWTGSVELPESGFEGGSATVSIEAASVDTRNEQRDNHLRSGDFFDAEKSPAITFTSKAVRPGKGEHFEVIGDLSIRGVAKEVTFSVEHTGTGKDPWGNSRHGFRVEATINRKDFGLNWNQALEAGGVLVSEQVQLLGEFQLTQAK